MDPEFEQRWRRARALENAGDIQVAKRIYETLIAEDPERLYVRLRLSAIEQAERNYRGARDQAIRCADSVRYSRWKDLAAVTRRLLTFDERDLVGALINGADWSHPDVLRNSPALSQYLWLIGEVPEALRLIEAAMPFAGANASLSYSRANALRYLGRMEDATREYERCIAINPNDANAHWSLAYHHAAKPPGSRVGRILKAQEAFAEDAEEQTYLHYALFKEFDDAGEVGPAWKHLQAGATLKRKLIRYNPQLEDEGFEALVDMTGPDFSRERTKGHDGEFGHAPIFIVGMPRSGTTLLERILGGHPQVSPGGELNDFESALSWESNQFMGLFLRPDVLGKLQGIDYSEVGRRYLTRTESRSEGRPFLIDKTPGNFVNAGFIARALPQARILCLRRDPMDACMSNLKNLFTNDAFGYSYDLDELADYYLRFDRLCTHWRETLGGQFLEVSYEHLAADPMTVSERVMAFCGIPFDPGLVDITRNTAPVTTASSSQVRQPINTRGIGAWRKYEKQLQPLRMRLEAELGRDALLA